MSRIKLTDELRQWYGWAKEYSQGRKSYDSNMDLYFCSWWLGIYYSVGTPGLNRIMNRLVKLGYLTKESKVGSYTKYTFTDKEMKMPNPKDDLPVMVVTDPDGYLVLVGEPRKLTAKECRDYMAPGWEVKTMKFKEYKALNLNFSPEDGE